MPRLTQQSLTTNGVDHAVDDGEIAGDVVFFTAKAAVQYSDDLGRRLNSALCGKQKTIHHPAMQELTRHGEGHHCCPHAVTGDINAVEPQMRVQRKNIEDITRYPGRR